MDEFQDLTELVSMAPKVDENYGDVNSSPLSNSAIDSRFSIEHLKTNYLFGIDLVNTQGQQFPDSLLFHHLNAAIEYTEQILDIVITPTEFTERYDFYSTDFANWGFLNLYKKPLIEVKSLQMCYGNQPMLTIPDSWLQITELSSTIQMFPVTGATGSLIIGSDGQLFGLQPRWDGSPQLWRVKYIAGMKRIPFELYDFVYKRACLNILSIWGDLVLGAGIASQSLSIDGLSQSVTSTKSSVYNAASARCQAYKDDLDKMMPLLKSKYDGIRMTVV